MVESLKRSIEDLEPPTCPSCHTEMKWYRSAKMAETPATIAHYFMCPNCHRIVETRSTPRAADNSGPPRKLSHPIDRFSCAA